MNGKVMDKSGKRKIWYSKFFLNQEWRMMCWFEETNKLVPDYIEIRRAYKSKKSYFSAELTLKDFGTTRWKQVFSLDFEPDCESKKVEIPYNTMDKFCEITGHVVISDEPENLILNVDDERDLLSKSLNDLSNDFALLLDPKYTFLADIHLKCGSVIIPAHKIVLSVRSPFFLDMFSTKNAETQKNEVIITDIDIDVFRIMVIYIYTGKMEKLTVPLASDLLFAADKYKLKGLKTACCEYLKSNTSMKNALEILTIGDLHDPDLKVFAMEFICQNCELPSLEGTEKWKIMQEEKSSLVLEVRTKLVNTKRK
ncbi:speckle-type POZ protein [Trichonephila clavipes]|nr:speckle-type POZ protein [Trichonephila clavipes]